MSAPLSGLAPSSAYRFRLLAHNSLGDAAGEALPFATLEPEHLFGPCPANEAFRTGPSANLPDCRAYEQASPIDKNGGNIGGTVALVKAASGGDGITFESQAGLPGGEGSQSFPTYMASREGGEWLTRGMLPPASLGDRAGVLGWTPDFSQIFTVAGHTGGPGIALFARPRTGGPLTELVPYGAGSTYTIAGFSADDSTVVFHANGVLPVKAGDPTPAANRNVYAWDRESGELSLAGVLPDGSVPAEGSEVIRGYASDMHAVASDGSAFFLDRDIGGLYLRQHPTAEETAAKDGEGNCVPDPLLACTLAVSASQRTVPDSEAFEPHFRAAAADGSVAFFTSKQELTDDAHTTPNPDLIGRADISAGSEPATDVQGAFLEGPDVDALDADASHLYWVNTEAGTIGRSDLDGANQDPECIVLPQVEVEAGVFAPPHPRGIAVGVVADAGHLYWTSPADGKEGHGLIGRADISGSCAAAQTSAEPQFITGASNPLGIDTEGTHLYWANRGSSSVARATIDGSSEVSFTWFEDVVYARGFDVAVDPAHDYLFVARGAGFITARAKLSDPSDEPIGLPAGAGSAKQIDADGSHLYWPYAFKEAGLEKTENIARSDLDGKGAEHDFIPAENPAGIAVGTGGDSAHLYWGAHPSSRGEDLYRYDAETGGLADLAPLAQSVRGADVQGLLGTSADGAYAYFLANGAFDGASEGSCNAEELTGSCNLYLWHQGDPITFVARLAARDVGYMGDWLPSGRVSADGQTVLFASARRLSAYDNTGPCAGAVGQGHAPCQELYRWQLGDPAPTCVSCDPSGAPPAGPAGFGSISHPTTVIGAEIQMNLLSRNLSADGDRVFFETNDPLVAADTDGDQGCPGWGSSSQAYSIGACQDAYMWEAKGTGSCASEAQNGGCLYLLSTATSDQASFFADADPSGDNAFILTDSQLVGQDQDQLFDLYDLRVGGGLAAQSPPPPAPPCEADSCKGAPTPPPELPSPARFSGPGNPPPHRGCPKGRVRRHHRCVKKHHRRRHHSKNAARRGRAGR